MLCLLFCAKNIMSVLTLVPVPDVISQSVCDRRDTVFQLVSYLPYCVCTCYRMMVMILVIIMMILL